MKIAIIGSRECEKIDFAGNLEAVLNVSENDTIISGGAKGIDTLAANYAKEKKNKPYRIFARLQEKWACSYFYS